MSLPSGFKAIEMPLKIPEDALSNPDPTKFTEQRFMVGNLACRIVGLRLYRYFRRMSEQQWEDDGAYSPMMYEKEALVAEVFSERERKLYANMNYVGRHIVNAVIYKPVFQRRLKNTEGKTVSVMCWRFHSPRDVEFGLGVQIGTWLGDFLVTHSGDYNKPSDFTESTLADELQAIYDTPESDLEDLYFF